MISQFEESGNLPKGVHKASLNEIRSVFGEGSARRKWLIGNLEKIINLAESTGHLERVIIWGSFVSRKEVPRDVDLLLIMDEDFSIDNITPEARLVFNYVQAKIAFSADIFWTKISIGEAAKDLWLETYQMTRDFMPRGIVEVILND